MDSAIYEYVEVLWEYMRLDMPLRKADCIVGFGCYNEDIALRCADLYHAGYAPRVLFTGGLGRNTKEMWTESEAERFARIALAAGVPERDILIENRSTNSAENIIFTRELLEKEQIPVRHILGVHKPFMERRVNAAMGVYWPEVKFTVTSPQVSVQEYIALSVEQGMEEKRVIEVLVGDFQRIDVYARKGYQLPQEIPPHVTEAFEKMVALGYTRELVSE